MNRIDKTYIVNVTPIILHLENQGMTEDEVKDWFKANNPDSLRNAEVYYRGIEAGIPDPLSYDFDTLVDMGLLDWPGS
jgi:hypothetical protein